MILKKNFHWQEYAPILKITLGTFHVGHLGSDNPHSPVKTTRVFPGFAQQQLKSHSSAQPPSAPRWGEEITQWFLTFNPLLSFVPIRPLHSRLQTKADHADNAEVELTRCSRGHYFGELALVTNKPRAASAYAVGDVKCLGETECTRTHSLNAFVSIDAQKRNSNVRCQKVRRVYKVALIHHHISTM